jgi:hypothetical protein
MKTFLLFPIYWIGGIVMAVFIACAIGMFLSAVIALGRKYTLSFFYLLGAAFFAGGCKVILLIAGTIGDHTGYRSQSAFFIGLFFPGILMLPIISQFVAAARSQIKGIEDP